MSAGLMGEALGYEPCFIQREGVPACMYNVHSYLMVMFYLSSISVITPLISFIALQVGGYRNLFVFFFIFAFRDSDIRSLEFTMDFFVCLFYFLK